MGDARVGAGRVVAAIALLVSLVAAGSCGSGNGSGGLASATATRPTTTAEPQASTTTPTTAPPPSTTAPTTTAPAGVTVTEVVDGDTIVVEGGVRVRLIGIDTPERGAPGFHESAAALSALVAGKRVQLVAGARDDVDKYGRLLRYVEVDGVDANLEMLRSGHARTRYDSRDGYGAHAREAEYVAADAASPDLWSVPAPPSAPVTTAAPPQPAPLAGGGTDPRFGTCKEAIANGFGPYRRGVDPEYDWYRDADSDGIVCE